MKKFVLLALMVAGILSLCSCASSTALTSSVSSNASYFSTTEELTAVPVNPITNYDEFKEMQDIADFTLSFPAKIPSNFSEPEYYSVNDYIFRARYTKNDGTQEVLISVSKLEKEPSGDYTDYATTRTVEIGGNTVTCKTNNGDAEGAEYLATFSTSDGINYAINGVTMDELEILVNSIK